LRWTGNEAAIERVVVRAPASTSNLGPGYDVFGLALDVMYDTVEVSPLDTRTVVVKIEGVGAGRISVDPEKNSAGRTAMEFLERLDGFGVKICVKKGIPPGSGLGSSGATATATVVAVNHLFNLKIDKRELTEIAAKGEITSAGVAHADNVAPSMYGGFVIIRSYNPLEILAFPPPSGLEFALAVPKGIKKTTKEARSVVPEHVELSRVIHNLGGAATIVAGMLLSNAELVGKGLLGDQIAEPARASLYPGYLKAKKSALESGALGVTLSGAGPTVIAIADREKVNLGQVAQAMREAFEAEGIECCDYVTRPTTGAYVVENATKDV